MFGDDYVLGVRALQDKTRGVVEFPDLADFKPCVLPQVGVVVAEEPQATEVIVEIVATDAHAAWTHSSLRRDQDSHGTMSFTGTLPLARRSATRERWHADGRRSTQKSAGIDALAAMRSIAAVAVGVAKIER